MKKILTLIAIASIGAAAVLTGCNNKPPFERLAEAVDSVNTYFAAQPEQTAPGAKLIYDQVTNTLKINYQLPSAEVASFFQDNAGVAEDILLKDVLPEAPFELLERLVDAKANVMIVYDWKPDGHSEYLIETDRVKDALKAAQQDAETNQNLATER